MKKFNLLLSLVLVAVFSICVSNSYAQSCTDEDGNPRPTGIALTHADDQGNHTAPTAAMSLPHFKGGNREMYHYIYQNLQYPKNLKSQNISGQSQVKFTVNADSTITNVEIFQSSGYKEMDDEAVRIVKSFPNWVPAKQDCQCVPMNTVVIVPFDATKK